MTGRTEKELVKQVEETLTNLNFKFNVAPLLFFLDTNQAKCSIYPDYRKKFNQILDSTLYLTSKLPFYDL